MAYYFVSLIVLKRDAKSVFFYVNETLDFKIQP